MAKGKTPTPETFYTRNSRQNIIIALEGLDFYWDEKDTNEVVEMWKQGIPIEMIASNYGRDEYEVIVLLLHLTRKGRISKRIGGIWGGKCKQNKCKYPECASNAETQWALVDLCKSHKDLIQQETLDYYKQYGSILYTERTHYLKIAHLTPLSQMSRRKVKE